ncbi:MAG: SDR family NAD(P)-dependent oxidoreductase [Deltaproteobacteria bacterium]|nr:MAG: SDR family NAD(P)-dependent oxidoreductase [Deltaproteobacteria bacterium]
MGILAGKVVVVTGAGRGIGRCHALLMAQEGAKVVVNDLGSERDGGGRSSTPADRVVEEITAAGGEACADYHNVAIAEEARAIVQTAVDRFGRIDVLVNNAGILRDKTLLKMEEEMWDAVIAVHLKGTFLCTQAAARQMKAQGTGGRIINTSSGSGLIGNFGQSNYGAAKAGIYGLTRVAALELAHYGITVNAIAPLARTRMTEGLSMVTNREEELDPAYISPLVAYLASDEAAPINGRVFGVAGGRITEYRMEVVELGLRDPKEEGPWSVEAIAREIAPKLHANTP